MAIGETHQAELLLSVLQCVTISVSVACRGREVKWIAFQKSPLGDRYLSFLSDDMQEKRKDGCVSAVLEVVLALRCPLAQSL